MSDDQVQSVAEKIEAGVAEVAVAGARIRPIAEIVAVHIWADHSILIVADRSVAWHLHRDPEPDCG